MHGNVQIRRISEVCGGSTRYGAADARSATHLYRSTYASHVALGRVRCLRALRDRLRRVLHSSDPGGSVGAAQLDKIEHPVQVIEEAASDHRLVMGEPIPQQSKRFEISVDPIAKACSGHGWSPGKRRGDVRCPQAHVMPFGEELLPEHELQLSNDLACRRLIGPHVPNLAPCTPPLSGWGRLASKVELHGHRAPYTASRTSAAALRVTTSAKCEGSIRFAEVRAFQP